jgi:hypothetical protein
MEGPWVSPADRPTDTSWNALIDRAHQAGASWAGELVALATTINDLSEVTAEPAAHDVVMTNRDLGVAQVRLGAGGELVVMHWDFAGPMTREWELASTLFHWTSAGTNLEAARAFSKGYRQRRDASAPLTLESFSTVVTGWLTWLLHRGWEASDPEPSEKRDFAERALRELIDDPLTIARLNELVHAGR